MNNEVPLEPWGNWMKDIIQQYMLFEDLADPGSPGNMDWGAIIYADPDEMVASPNHWDWLEEYLYQMPSPQLENTQPIQNMGPQGEFWNFGT